MAELLETRLAPAVVSWDGGGGNFDWGNRFNWNHPTAGDPNTLPGAGDDAIIGAAFSGITVSTSGNVTVRSVSSEARLNIPVGNFSLAANSTINNAVTTNGMGRLTLGSLTLSGAGTLTNSGTLDLNGSTLGVNLVNNGAVNVNLESVFSRAGGLYVNNGSITFDDGIFLNITGQGQTFRQSGGTLIFLEQEIKDSPGLLILTNATFDFQGGAMQRPFAGGVGPVSSIGGVFLTSAALTIGPTAGAGNFLVRGNSTLSGNVAVGQELEVEGTLTSATSFTNAGNIQVNGNGSGLTVTTGTLTNTGTLDFHGGTLGGNQTLAANLINTGTITVAFSNLALGRAGANDRNSGQFRIGHNGGVTSVSATFTNAAGGTLTIVPRSTLQVNGSYTQTTGGTLHVQVGGAPASGQFGRLTATGAASLDGALRASVVSGYVPTTGHTFPVQTFASRTGTYSAFYLQTVSGGSFQANVLATETVLNAFAVTTNLAVTNVSTPASGVAGQVPASPITFTVTNSGEPTTVSQWMDSVYLSTNTTLDDQDLLLDRVPHTGVLAMGGSYVGSVNRPLPNLAPGDYHVIVVTDSRLDVPDVSRANNTVASTTRIAVSVPTLTLGTPLAGTLGQGDQAYYRVAITAGSTLRLRFDSQSTTARNEMFVGAGRVPTSQDFDFAGINLGPDQEIFVSNSLASEFFILVRGAAVTGGPQPFTIRADLASALGLTGVDISSAGNAGPVTFLVRGGGFRSTTTFRLIDSGTTQRNATSTILLDATQAFVTFNLAGAPVGPAELRAIDGAVTAVLPGAVQVRAGVEGKLSVRLEAPERARLFRMATWYVNYANVGDADLPIPLLRFSLPGAAFLSTSPTGANLGRDVLLLGLPDGRLHDALRPGESVRIPFYGLLQQTTTATLTGLRTDYAGLVAATFDWNAILNTPPPGGGVTPAWTAYVNALRADYGENLSEFYTRQLQEARAIAQSSHRYESVRHINGVWHFQQREPSATVARPIIRGPGAPGSGPAGPAGPGGPAGPAGPGDGNATTHVVVIAIEDYSTAGYNPLPGASVDSTNWVRHFHNKKGIPLSRIHVLSDRPADGLVSTKADAVSLIQSTGADGDDNLVIVYSGHGDGVTGMPSTGRWVFNDGSLLSAPEMEIAIENAGAGKTYFISDSCFSGNLIITLDSLGVNNTVFFAGGAPGEVVGDGTGGGGTFTSQLISELEFHPIGPAFLRAAARVRPLTVGTQNPTTRNPNNFELSNVTFLDPSGIAQQRLQKIKSFLVTVSNLIPRSTATTTIVGSFDPNDIVGPGGFGPEHFVAADQPLGYTIRFENLPTATAPAQSIVITQQLDADLNFTTFTLGDLGLGSITVDVPEGRRDFHTRLDLRTEFGLYLDITAGINLSTGLVTWTFASLDPATFDLPGDPLAGFLPPNRTPPAGEGFVSYTVSPRATSTTGARIDAQARIVFDENAPIDTPAIFNTIDAGRPVSSVTALPASTVGPNFLVRWGGQDDTGGSGIASFDVFVSDNGGPFTLWQNDTTSMKAVFPGQVGRTYAFYSVAQDNVGNEETVPAQPDTQTLVVAGTLRVIDTLPTSSGVTVLFNRPFDPATLNLYDAQPAGLGSPDLTLVGASTGTVNGSLSLHTGNAGLTFLRTGTVLPADSYTLTLRSAANGFKDTVGGLLDGNADGTAGDGFTASIPVTAPAAVSVSVPNVMRGPGQTVNVPATGTGLPLRLSDGVGVTTVRMTLQFNPALLTITAASVMSGMPAGSAVTFLNLAPGMVALSFTSPTALAAGPVDFMRLTASVPLTAPYTSKHLLDLSDVQVNAGAIAAVDDDGIHVVGYFGDTTGAGGFYTSLDSQRALRVAVGLDSGFSAYQLADPVLIADITGNRLVNSTDALRVLQEVVGLDRPEIPPLPANPSAIVMGGPDPLLNFSKRLQGQPGQMLTAPLWLDPSDGLESVDLAISYDAQQLEVVEVRRGSLTQDFDIFLPNVDSAKGTIRAGLSRSLGPIQGRGVGSVIEVVFRIRPGAKPGRTIINLRQRVDATFTALNEGGLDLIPDPSDEAGDRLDGVITVQRPRASRLDRPNGTTSQRPGSDLIGVVDKVFSEMAKRRRISV